jgi:hypothetical protein
MSVVLRIRKAVDDFVITSVKLYASLSRKPWRRMGEWNIAESILNLGVDRSEWSVSGPGRRSCRYAPRRGMDGSQNPPKPCAEEKNLFLVSGIEHWFICCVFRSLISIPAEHLTQNNSTKWGGANNSRIYSIVAGETCSFPGGGVTLSQLGTLATNWPILLAPDDRWWVWSSRWKNNLQGKQKYSEEICPNATLSSTNPTWPDLGSNPSRRVGNPTTNRLSYVTALVKPVTILLRAAGF